MKKRVLSILLALAMLICMIPMGMLTASAASTRCGITANWQSTSSLPSSSGTYYYYLTKDITLSSQYAMPAGVTLYLDLNGCSVNCNCTKNAGIYMGNSSSFYLYGTGGGSIKRINSTKGSAISLNNSSAYFYMHGGEITGFETPNSGGGVCVAAGHFYMDGGFIYGNTSSKYGGGVWVYNGTFTMEGGSIYSNTASSDGGGVNMDTGTFTMSGGTIFGNMSNTVGGGVSVYKTTFKMTGGEIYNNTAKTGGGIRFSTGTSYTINGGYIRSNNATNDSGISTVSATVTYTSGRFYTGNTYSAALPTSYYTVTLKKNDGTSTTVATTSQKWNTTNSLSSTALPTRAGYDFAGYYNATSGGDQYFNASGAATRTWDYIGAQTLYAQWIEHTATLSYNANGHGTAPASVTMKYTEETKAADAPEAVTGYAFTGWNTEANGTGTHYDAGAVVKAASVDPTATTLYAEWEENTATLTYDANGHGTAPAAVTMTYTEETKAATAPTATGYTFNGWNTDADGKGNSYAAGDTVKAANTDPTATTLYAQWSANVYAVTLNTDGTCDALTAYTYGVGATLPTPTKEKSYFLGWYDNADFTGSPITAIADDETGDKEFFAKWATVLYEYELTGAPTLGGDKDGTYSISTYYLDDAGEKVYIEKNRNTDVAISFESWYLRTMYQYRTIDGQLDIRFVSMLNDLIDDYAEAGFVFRIDELDWEETVTTNEVYTSFKASEIDQYIADYSRENDYFFLQNTLFSEDVVKEGYTVTVYAFVTTKDGTTYHGAPITIDLSALN